MPPELRQMILDRFDRLERTEKRAGEPDKSR
jgi:hypothetical protein